MIYSTLVTMVWALVLIGMGISEAYSTLGGCMIIYWIIPVLLFSSSKRNKYIRKIIWSTFLTILGILLVNYLQQFYIGTFSKYPVLILSYIIYLPILIIYIGFICLIRSVLRSREEGKSGSEEDKIRLKNFDLFLITFMSITLFSIPVVLCFKYSKSISGYEIALIVFIIAAVHVILEMNNMSPYAIKYYGKNLQKLPTPTGRTKKYILVVISIMFIISLLDEYFFRGNWLLWFESVLIIIIYFILVLKFRVILVESIKPVSKTGLYLPSGKDLKTVIVISFGLIITIACALFGGI